jgi:hypothetical protein
MAPAEEGLGNRYQFGAGNVLRLALVRRARELDEDLVLRREIGPLAEELVVGIV